MPYFLDFKIVEQVIAQTIEILQKPLSIDDKKFTLMSDELVGKVKVLLTEKLNNVKLTEDEYRALHNTDSSLNEEQLAKRLDEFAIRLAGALTFKSSEEMPSNENTAGFGLAYKIYQRLMYSIPVKHNAKSLMMDTLNPAKALASKEVAAEVHIALAQLLDVDFGFKLLEALLEHRDTDDAIKLLREEKGAYAALYSLGATETWKRTVENVRAEVRLKYADAVKSASGNMQEIQQRFDGEKVERLLNSELPSHADEGKEADLKGGAARLFRLLSPQKSDSSTKTFELSTLKNAK
jgi:hypothetical protein